MPHYNRITIMNRWLKFLLVVHCSVTEILENTYKSHKYQGIYNSLRPTRNNLLNHCKCSLVLMNSDFADILGDLQIRLIKEVMETDLATTIANELNGNPALISLETGNKHL